MAIVLDGSTPAAADATSSTSGTQVTASFSPPAGALVVVAVNLGYDVHPASGPTITVADSLGNSYASGPWAWDGQWEGAYLFSFPYTSAPGSITVTATRTVSTGAALFEVVTWVLTGTGSQAGAGTGFLPNSTSVTAFTSSITTTATGSWTVVSAAIAWVQSLTPVSVTTDHAFTNSTDGETGVTGHAVTGTPGAATLGWTGTVSGPFAWAALEILPSPGTSAHAGLPGGAGAAQQAGGQHAQQATGTGTAQQAGASSTTATSAPAGLATAAAAAQGVFGLNQAATLSGTGSLTAAVMVTFSPAPVLSGSGTLSATGVMVPGTGAKTGVYRGPCGIYAQNGVTSGGAQSGITAYGAWLGRPVTYVLDYIVNAPASTAQFTGAFLYKAAGGFNNLNQWGALPGSQIMMLGIPACIGATAGGGAATTWAQEAAGNSDSYWTTLGNNLVTWGYGNAVLRIGREFNYPGYSWSPSTTGDTIAQYVAGYQHIVTLLRGIAGSSFKFMWNPALSPGSMSGQTGNNADTQRWYPGSAYTDYIGIDAYDWGNYPQETSAPWGNRTLAQQQSNWSYLQTQQDGLNSWISFAFNNNQTLSLPEWGLQLWLSGGSYYGGGDDPYYIQQFYNIMPGFYMQAMWEDPGQGLFDTDAYAGRTASMQAPDASRTLFLSLFGSQYATLSGTGSLSAVSRITFASAATLSGSGTIFVLATGGLVFGSSISTPYAYPLASQVMVAPPGTSQWVPIGSIGVVTALTYGFTCPGGCDQMTATIMVPAAYRTQLFNPGWQVKITRGGHQVWDGKLDEPVPTPSGWNLTASGTGNRGHDYVAVYADTWPTGEPDESVNAAISRGMPWVNPGIGQPAGAWFGQAVDPGAQTITALLNLVCTRGAYTWYVNSQPGGYPGDDLSVFRLPSVPNRLLSSVNPAPRTLGGDINTIFLRYQISAGTTNSSGTSVPAAYGTTSVQNAVSVLAHGELETYIDLSDVGTMTQAAAQAVGNSVLAIYQRASFAGPFSASYGQLMTSNGVPIDPGTDQAGTVVKLILSDFGYGGEVTPQFPITFIVGSYMWDDKAQTATITPYQSVDVSLTGLLSLENTILTPITVASA
jgi:hypothetical protein